MKGWGPKSSVCPSKLRETKVFGGMSQDFCRDAPELPEKFEKKKVVFNFWPLKLELFAKGPVQSSLPRGVAENWFTKTGILGSCCVFSKEKQQNTNSLNCHSVRTPGNLLLWFFVSGPDPLSSDK